MQRTSSCGQLESLRKIAPPLNAGAGAGSEFKNTAFALGRRLCRDSSPRVAVSPSGLHLLRKLVMPQGKLQLSKLDQQASLLQQREKNLDLPEAFTLFDWPSVKPPTGALASGSQHEIHIPKPLGCAKLVLADLYEKKYGILIECGFGGQGAQAIVDALIDKVSDAKGQAVGFVVPARSPEHWNNVSTYRGHVVPLIIQQTETGFDVVNLDSLADNAPHYTEFLDVFRERMALRGAKELRHVLVENRRQADTQSCHTDAVQVLKDTLCMLKEHGDMNCLNSMVDKKEDTGSSRHLVRFSPPSFLQKTNQRSQALVDDHFDGVSPLQPKRVMSAFGEKSITIGQHRYKYTAELGSRKSNYFLTVKAFYNAGKVLDHLENMPDSGQRQRYLAQLANPDQ